MDAKEWKTVKRYSEIVAQERNKESEKLIKCYEKSDWEREREHERKMKKRMTKRKEKGKIV